MKYLKLILILNLTVVLLLGCNKKETVNKKAVDLNSPSAKVVVKFLKLIDKEDYEKAFELWDFKQSLPKWGYNRLSKKEEIKRWKRYIVSEWKKEGTKPYIYRIYDEKNNEISVIIKWKSKKFFFFSYEPEWNSEYLILRLINNKWKIVATATKY